MDGAKQNKRSSAARWEDEDTGQPGWARSRAAAGGGPAQPAKASSLDHLVLVVLGAGVHLS